VSFGELSYINYGFSQKRYDRAKGIVRNSVIHASYTERVSETIIKIYNSACTTARGDNEYD
jgi:hypothetical protein